MEKHQFFVHIPATMIGEFEGELKQLPVGLEILVDHEALDPAFAPELERIAGWLRQSGRPCRMHAPFRDLAPAGHDPRAVNFTRERIGAALELAPRLGVRNIVAHPAWNPEGDRLEEEAWLDRAVSFWLEMGRRAEALGCRFALENIFDRDPHLLGELLDRLPEATFGVNFDLGHWHAHARAPLAEWFRRLGPRLLSVHLHDNCGRADEHLALGAGSIPLPACYSLLRALNRPLEWTVENRSLADVLASAAHLAEHSGIPEFAGLAFASRAEG